MFTKEQLAKWEADGFTFPPEYSEWAVVARDDVRINSIRIIPGELGANGDPQLTILVACDAYNNLVQVEIDGRKYNASLVNGKTIQDAVNPQYSVDVFVKIPVPYERFVFRIVASIIEPTTGKILKQQTTYIEIANDNSIKDGKPDNNKYVNMVTYKTYWNTEEQGYIEKITPKYLEPGLENKIAYIYIDQNENEHTVCILDSHEIWKKETGKVYPGPKPTDDIVYENTVNEGQTEKRVLYKNNDIAEYGANGGEKFWLLYRALNERVTLVRMEDNLSFNSGELNIAYKFSSTKRRYTNPLYYAAFIGVLADCNFIDVFTSGVCFEEGSCFPSKTHNNGFSVDTNYLDDKREQIFINAFYKFGFRTIYRGPAKKAYTHTKSLAGHNSHLHSGNLQLGVYYNEISQ